MPPADTDDTRPRPCPFHQDNGCRERPPGFRALLHHLREHHCGQWPRANREHLSRPDKHPWPDAPTSFELDDLTPAQLDIIVASLESTDAALARRHGVSWN